MSPTKFYALNQIMLQMWSSDQSLREVLSMREVIITSILQVFDQKKQFLGECSLFKFNNLELTLGVV